MVDVGLISCRTLVINYLSPREMLARSVPTSPPPRVELFPGASGRAPVYLSLSSSNSPPQSGSFPEGSIHFVSYDSGNLVLCSLAGCGFLV